MQSSGKTKDVGIILCECPDRLGQRLDFVKIERELRRMPEVADVQRCTDLCNRRLAELAVGNLLQNGATRIVVGACLPDHIRRVLDDVLLKKAHVNEALCWAVNLNEQCARAIAERAAATEKIVQQLAVGVRRVRLATPVRRHRRRISTDVAVIGGTLAAAQAAIGLANLGHRVHVINCDDASELFAVSPEYLAYLAENRESADELARRAGKEIAEQTSGNRRIRFYTVDQFPLVTGELGNFRVSLPSVKPGQPLRVGAVVIATEAPTQPVPVDIQGASPGTTTNLDGLLHILRSKGTLPRKIAILMDQGIQQDAVRSAQVLSVADRLARHGTRVSIFCEHVRVAAWGLEALYRRVREAGVLVLRGVTPQTRADTSGGPLIEFTDPITGARCIEQFDLIVSADHQPDLAAMAAVTTRIAGLRSGPAASFQPNNVWLTPVLTNRPGIFAVGAARARAEHREALTDGWAAAAEVHALLPSPTLEVVGDAAAVDPEKCVLCLTCLRICPHGAVAIDHDRGAAVISEISCQRCGTCVAECPALAIHLPRYTDQETAVDIGPAPKVVVFACVNSAIPAADLAAELGMAYSPDVTIVRVPCAGQVDPRAVVQALNAGARRVLLLGCHPESCRYLSGATRASKRAERLTLALKEAGLDPALVSFAGLAANEAHRFLNLIETATEGTTT